SMLPTAHDANPPGRATTNAASESSGATRWVRRYRSAASCHGLGGGWSPSKEAYMTPRSRTSSGASSGVARRASITGPTLRGPRRTRPPGLPRRVVVGPGGRYRAADPGAAGRRGPRRRADRGGDGAAGGYLSGRGPQERGRPTTPYPPPSSSRAWLLRRAAQAVGRDGQVDEVRVDGRADAGRLRVCGVALALPGHHVANAEHGGQLRGLLVGRGRVVDGTHDHDRRCPDRLAGRERVALCRPHRARHDAHRERRTEDGVLAAPPALQAARLGGGLAAGVVVAGDGVEHVDHVAVVAIGVAFGVLVGQLQD